jgi:transposase-like protein
MIVEFQKTATACKYCNSNRIVKDGTSLKGLQRYQCKDCKVRFTQNEAYPKFTYSIEIMNTVFDLYKEEYKSSKIIKIINEKYGVWIAKRTIFEWIAWSKSKIGINAIKEFESRII